LILIFAVLLVFMFFSSRKARRQQMEKLDFQSALEPGQEVVTASGLVGTVQGVEGDLVTLEHAPGSVTTWVRAAIARPYEPIVDDEDVEEDSSEGLTSPDDDGPATPGLLDKP